MILVAAIVASVLIAKLRGGRVGALVSLSVRWGALAIVGFAVQAFFIYHIPMRKTVGVWGWQEALFIGSYALLLATLWANRRIDGVPWIGLGLLLNLLVMVANGGWMPVTPEAITRVGLTHLAPELTSGMRLYSSKDIILSARETRLWFLSDIFVLSRPFPVPSVFSVGDVFVALGAFVLLQSAMTQHRKQHL